MKHLFHHFSTIILSFFSFTLLLISIINLPTCMCDDYYQYKNCSNAFTCEGSKISHLHYPFWGDNRPQYCGYSSNPNTKLTCKDSAIKITLDFVTYRIVDWDDSSLKLTVARDDYWNGICSVSNNYKNSTFDNTLLQPHVSGSASANLTLLYNCNINKLVNNVYNATCGETKVVYTLADPGSITCNPTVIVEFPTLVTESAKLANVSDINKALRSGFDLKWTRNKDCPGCFGSGGVCGNDGGSEFRCFCKDGPYKTSCTSEKALSSSKGSERNLGIVIGASVGGFAVALIIIIMIFCHLKRGTRSQQQVSLIPLSIFRKRRNLVDQNVEVFMRSYNLSLPRRYSYTEVKKITNSFRDKLGQGGYGVVYKACLTDGRQVAVKVISESKGNGEEFINEVASISRTSHMNVVSLLGFCYEVNKRALIYEFMPKGSLDKFIYKSESPSAICDFDWNTLFQIAIGIARGLEYLHDGCSSRILHLDIKPQNILLDEDFCPKICDFGLAKVCQKKDSIVSMLGTRGTIGYMAPEVYSRAFGGVSYKSDVYSYGMLILEMIGGRKNYDTGGHCTSEMYFPDWIYMDLEQENTLLNCLTISEEENDMVKKITMVSLWCIQTKPSDRPPMNKVIEMLLGPLSSVAYPPIPVIFSPDRQSLQVSDVSSSGLYETNSIEVSK